MTMAPEEILSSADANRRNFLKKVLAGTTFAVPVIASFSMEGLSPGNAWAQTLECNPTSNQTLDLTFCANMTSSPCCTLAAEITVAIWSLGTDFIFAGRIIKFPFFEPTADVQALLLGGLVEPLKAMTEGIAKGKGDCTKKPAVDQFKRAAKELGKFLSLAEQVCQGGIVDQLVCDVGLILDQINELVSGHCEPC
jgi:hypothetical protein